MHRNYFLFELQVAELKPSLLGKTVNKVFTYRKDELIFELQDDHESKYLKAGIAIHLPYFLLGNTEKIRTNKYEMFERINHLQIYDIFINKFDKQISIDLDQFKLLFRFFGKDPNILILDRDGTLLDSFKSNPIEELSSRQNGTDIRTISRPEFFRMISEVPEQILSDFLMKNFGGINGTLAREILFRSSVEPHTRIADIDESGPARIFENMSNLFDEMYQSPCYIYHKNDRIQKLSLIRLNYLEENSDGLHFEKYDSINKAWIRYIEQIKISVEFDRLFSICEKAVGTKLEYLKRSLKKTEEYKNISKRKAEAETIGNLLLTLQNQIKPGESEVMVENIFSDNREKIKIKLNPNKSAVENAQIYFAKYKDIDKHRFLSQIKTDTLAKEIKKMEEYSAQIKKNMTLLELRKLHTQLENAGILRESTDNNRSDLKTGAGFYHLVLEKEWDLYIGKNAENNEQLTFHFAYKWDWWFHAQGVAGSHVILHLKHKDAQVPRHLIEKAAQFAAGYSKAQHSGTVPVIYTKARYVSRIRNAPKGTVKTYNARTIFVQPLKNI